MTQTLRSSTLAIFALTVTLACGAEPNEVRPGDDQERDDGIVEDDERAGDGQRPRLDTGRLTLRRLNRVEFDNTVRDLLGTTMRPGTTFPGDGIKHGFDTQGDGLQLSPLHVELTEAAAASLIDEFLAKPADDPKRSRLLACPDPATDAGCLAESLTRTLRLAFRRPVADGELESFVALADAVTEKTGLPGEGLRAALSAILLSPHFLFMVERDPDPNTTAAHPVSDHELAVRLSYFLWSSMPDEELMQLADDGQLTALASEQAERMLGDERASALVDNFAGQWLFTRPLAEREADRNVFPDFTPELRESMRQETGFFFAHLVNEARPLTELLLAPYTFADETLARHYGLDGVVGGEIQQVSTEGWPRGGLLAHASLHTVTSHPDRSSVVRRGVWVLENLLCSAPPPPPPEVEPSLTVSRETGVCAACHKTIDPVGQGLAHFDGIGAHRTEAPDGASIDATGVLPDGTTFDGHEELARIIADDPRFTACVLEKALTYATGRSFADGADYIQALAAGLGDADSDWRRLLLAVVKSEAFQTRRAHAMQEGER